MEKRFEIIDHGWEHEQYFQGCGTAFSDHNYVVTGTGSDSKEAYEDAVEQIYQAHLNETVDRLHLPTRPRGINKKYRVPTSAGDEAHWYVSIRYTL